MNRLLSRARARRHLKTLPLLPLLAPGLQAQLAPKDLTIAPSQRMVAYHGRFAELPIGSIKPRGWIKSWLERQSAGLTGHPENLAYPYDTVMFTGKIPPPSVKHGETWWPYEQAGYFVDAAVRLNHLINAPDVQRISAANLDYILGNSSAARLGESFWGWPNAVVGRALMAQHSATADPKVLQVLSDYLTGTGPWFSRDGFIFEQALYVYGQTGDRRMLELAKQIYDRLFLSDPGSSSHVDKLRGAAPLREHGVTAAEQLKLLPMMYAFTGDVRSLELASLAYRKVEADSLMPDGAMVSSENLGTAAFGSLHESCDITDWPWSIGYLLLAGGEGHWADLIERATFNALPGAVTKDFQQLQYFSSVNQVLASNTACARIAPTRMSYRAAHDTECCSGNISRAMPNYVSRMWLRSGDGLVAALYGPSEVTTVVDDHKVTLIEETGYPFRDTISFSVKTGQPVTFPLALRIPEWCVAAEVTVNGKVVSLEARPGTFAVITREFCEGDTIVLRLPMRVQLERWYSGRAVTVTRGPLVYSVAVPERRVLSERDPEPIRHILKGNNIQGFPAIEFFPAGEWRYGVEAARVSSPEELKVIESPVTDNPFLVETTPVRIEIALSPLPRWQAAWQPEVDSLPADFKQAPKNPVELPAGAELADAGSAQTLSLVPYGATHLRLTTFPVINQ